MWQLSRKRMRAHWRELLSFLVFFVIVTVYTPNTVKAAETIPTIPHDTNDRQECLLCHSTGGVLPIPSNHASYDQKNCLTCHKVADINADTTDDGEDGTTDYSHLADSDEKSCQQCHNNPDLGMTVNNGETLSLYVDPSVYANSIHGDKLLCTDCHTTVEGYPHQDWEINSKREYSIAQYELCKRCHFDNYTKSLDSIHYEMLSEGDMISPVCTDCHGAHDVSSPSQPRAKISQTCSKCHSNIYEEYVSSVHGTSLVKENNYDVPVCTDCHLAHTIEDPRTASFRIESVHLCSKCHGDPELMEKYGISSDVVKTYLNDFHGRTVALVEKQTREIWVDEAVCTDCHGIHNIQQADSPNSPVIKENLVSTCNKCHDNASLNFSGAWLSHYEPSLSKTPLIFFITWFYRIFIPFIIGGLLIHILLDLWRKITNR